MAFSMITNLGVDLGFKLYRELHGRVSPLLLQDPGQAGVAVELGGGLSSAHECHGLRHDGVREVDIRY